MSITSDTIFRIVLIGIGATAVMDVWLQLLKWAGVPTQSFAMLGRWIGHWREGQWHHEAIAKAPPVMGETWMGWTAHYVIGIGFAAVLVMMFGGWAASPKAVPAVAVGLATVAAPLLIMQPAYGAGMFSRKTKTPLRNTIKSIVNHAVFGAGLYLAAMALHGFGAAS